MEFVKQKYKQAYRKFGKTKEALFWPKGRQKERFKLLTQFFKKTDFSVLDFGCGFGDLKKFLDKTGYRNFIYVGVDIVEEFVKECKAEDWKGNTQFKLINKVDDIKDQFDYIVISGTFNISYYQSIERHEKEVKYILKYLFTNCLKPSGILSVDFMHDEVDYTQPGAYHVNIPKMYDFITTELSPRVVINKHIFCYEVTFNIFKNTTKNNSNLYEDFWSYL